MAEQKTIIIVAVVAIVAIAGIAAFFLMNGGGNGGGSDDPDEYLTPDSGKAKVSSIDTRLLVFGNANNDVYLDQKDVDFIQDIVDGKTKWDSKKNPLADTNADGVITDKDVGLLKQFIKKNKAPMFYLNSKLETQKIQFPLTGNIVISQYIDADMLKICGKYDMITASSEIIPDEKSYPGSSKWKDVGGYPYDYEKVVAAGVSITLGQDYNYDDTFDKLVKEGYDSYRIDTVKLFEGRYMNNIDAVNCTITLGALLNSFDVSTYKEYLDYVNNINEIIEKATSGITESKSYSLVLTHATISPSDMGIDNRSTSVTNYSDVDMAESLKMIPSYPVGSEGYMRGKTIEDILKYKPDTIFIEESNGSQTYEDFHEVVNEIAGWFRSSGYTGTIIGIHWSVCGSSAFVAALPLLATYVYGNSVYDVNEAWNDLATYYNSFLGKDMTVDELKNSIYGPFIVP